MTEVTEEPCNEFDIEEIKENLLQAWYNAGYYTGLYEVRLKLYSFYMVNLIFRLLDKSRLLSPKLKLQYKQTISYFDCWFCCCCFFASAAAFFARIIAASL